MSIATAMAVTFICAQPTTLSATELRCADGRHVRLYGIEVRQDMAAARRHLASLVGGRRLICRIRSEGDRSGRAPAVARCRAGAIDLSCRQLRAGFATGATAVTRGIYRSCRS